ncbi:tetratricopeptide repeat domain-containing protein [Camillea tinctor]|nr:tetratricopeptide repeat domain-containing protein [Camillea tinctor]
MADAYSIATASIGLLDVTIRLLKYVKALKDGSTTIQEELDSLEGEVTMLEQVCNAVNFTYEKSVSISLELSPQRIRPGQSSNATGIMWAGLAQMVKHCHVIVERIHKTLEDICQMPKRSFSKHVDTMVRVHRKRSKEESLRHCRSELAMYQGSIQLILTIINREETQDSQKNTAESFETLINQLSQIQSYTSDLDGPAASTGDAEYDKEALLALRELKKSIANAAQLIVPLTVNKYFKTPQSVSSIFTGRESLLLELNRSFIQSPGPLRNQHQRRFVIHGLGGSGKTQFCCKFAEDNRERFWGVFSVDGSSAESIEKSLGDIAKLADRDPNASAALHWLSTVEERWLLLIDNADDVDVNLEDYFPKGVGGHILITTRNRAFRVLGNVDPGYYDFSGLGFDEASDLLLKASSLPMPWLSSWEILASEITKALGHLALAIVQAGAAIRERLCNLQDYLGWYDRSWQKVRQDHVGPIKHHEKAVWATWEMCYERLEQKKDKEEVADAIELLHIFAFLYRDDLSPVILMRALTNAQLEAENERKDANATKVATPQQRPSFSTLLQNHFSSIWRFMIGIDSPTPLPSMLRHGLQPSRQEIADDRIRLALSELDKMSLIYYNDRNETYTMHPVVHDWARKRPRMKPRHQALWADIAGQVLSASILLPPLGTGIEDEMYRASLLPHIEHVQKCRAEIHSQMDLISSHFWLSWLTRRPSKSVHRIRMFAKFSLVYLQCGQPQRAEPLLAEVVASLSHAEGPRSSKTRTAQAALAQAYWHQGKISQALNLQQNIVATCKKYFGHKSPETLEALHKLSVSLWQQGMFSTAKEIQVDVVENLTKLFGRKHIQTLEAINDLGNTVCKFYRQVDLEESFDLHSEALEGMKELLGNDHIRTTYPKENLARVSCLIGDQALLEKALKLMEEVVETRKARMGKEAVWTLMAMANMAVVLGALGRVQKAEVLILDALPIAERNMGSDNIGVLFGRQILATMLIQQERYDEAEKILVGASELQKNMSSRTDNFHPDRIVSMVELARCYQLQGKLKSSIDTCDELIEGLQDINGGKHPFTEILIRARDEMAKVMEAQEGGHGFEAGSDIRFPEYLFKIYR